MPLPSLDFLLESSLHSLQDLELSTLARSSNVGKGVKVEMEEWVEQLAAAMLARWMIENREALLRAAASRNPVQLEDVFRPTRKLT